MRAVVALGHLCFRFRNVLVPIGLALILLGAIHAPFLVPPALDPWIDAIAVAIVLGGLVLRIAVIGAVGIRRSGYHRRMAAPQLHDSGPYGCCRHPLYLANGVILLGLTLAFDSPWMALVALPLAFAGLASMLVAEERFLAARFGGGIPLWDTPAGYAVAWLGLALTYVLVRVLKWTGRLTTAVDRTPFDWRTPPALTDDSR